MARARSIKPGFFKNEQLADLPMYSRLLFAGLWTIADREGRLEDRPKRIKAEVFPYDNVNIEKGLTALSNSGFILRYEVGGNRYIAIPKWDKHQNPHIKEAASTIPAPCEHDAGPVNDPDGNGTKTPCNLNPVMDSLNPEQDNRAEESEYQPPEGKLLTVANLCDLPDVAKEWLSWFLRAGKGLTECDVRKAIAGNDEAIGFLEHSEDDQQKIIAFTEKVCRSRQPKYIPKPIRLIAAGDWKITDPPRTLPDPKVAEAVDQFQRIAKLAAKERVF